MSDTWLNTATIVIFIALSTAYLASLVRLVRSTNRRRP